MNLEITKERVLEASRQSVGARATLEALFPDAFTAGKNIELEDFVLNCQNNGKPIFIANGMAPTFALRGKCFVLSANYDWEMSEYGGYKILIPTTK